VIHLLYPNQDVIQYKAKKRLLSINNHHRRFSLHFFFWDYLYRETILW